MRDIRGFEPEDAGAVARLYELVMRSGTDRPPPGLAPYLERVLIDQPWADPEIPSLVCVDDGRIVAFVGVSVRRGLLDGRPIRIAYGSHLVSHPDARHRSPGAMLIGAVRDGPQDLSICDSTSETTRRLGLLTGWRLLHLHCLAWIRVLRPLRAMALAVSERRGIQGPSRAGGLVSLVDAAAVRLPGRLASPPAPATVAEPLTPAALVEHAPAVLADVRLRVAYDEPFVTWLFGELSRMSGLGTLTAHLVRGRRDRVLGWYVYCGSPQRAARVVQIAAGRERDVDAVVDHLLHDAWAHGAAVIEGRLEPAILASLGERQCLTFYRRGALVHSRNESIIGAIGAGDALLTRMDGEWWIQDARIDLARSDQSD